MTGILANIVLAAIFALIVRIILDWVQVPAGHPVGRLRTALASVTDPMLMPLRRLIPPVRLGAVALDVSVIVLLVALQILYGVLRAA
ncbi:MAG: YggT family protein [Acidimicrobiia bacterium]|nr:YggT family protein [Acidimicrobiia bacterium]MBT8216574.1 YggT family protein [Acidimicrobiia bacterium]NNF11212.1 YggT family protein [Acidimicrobiia bacterium]NNL68948.1 YggT family protein [Acidimicrobiia bacterium]RZV40783.1 MAG: YggT family protein [Acidimicrobiia bacterium]